VKEIPKMPNEYKGKETKNGGYTINAPRAWTQEEIEWVKDLINKGYTNKEIAVSIDRSEVSTSIKIKRLSKKNTTYNRNHIDDKYKTNIEFLERINPKTIIDVYAGQDSIYKGYEVISNDKNEQFNTDYHLDALEFMCEMYRQHQKADVIDLDPFGSAYDCFDLAIKMAKKGLVITLGELGHKRWKRLDFVSRYYGIKTLDEFNIDNLIEHIKEIGRRNKKELIVLFKKEWQNIGRVWFEIQPLKITEQWGA
jgi:hypothetical protein